VVGVADDGDGLVPSLGEQPLEDEGDLTVTSGDDDAHRTSQRGRTTAVNVSMSRPKSGTFVTFQTLGTP
jgi:hypothetical protein